MSFPTTPYAAQHSPWVDSTGQRVDATTMNAVEGLLALLGAAVPASNGAMVWDGTKFTAAAGIKNANVDAGAAIARSKLDFGSGLVNADIASGAAIAQSKIAGTFFSGPGAITTTLPGSPSDGTQVIFTDSTSAPTFAWLLQWSASASAWVCLGGSPMYAEVATSESLASTSYTALATAGPSLTVARAGTYVIEHGFTIGGAPGSTGGYVVLMSYDIGGTGAVDADAVNSNNDFLSGQFSGQGASAVRKQRKSGIAAATAFVSKYKSNSANGQSVSNRWMSIMPVTVT